MKKKPENMLFIFLVFSATVMIEKSKFIFVFTWKLNFNSKHLEKTLNTLIKTINSPRQHKKQHKTPNQPEIKDI
jgi:hypothetical protein